MAPSSFWLTFVFQQTTTKDNSSSFKTRHRLRHGGFAKLAKKNVEVGLLENPCATVRGWAVFEIVRGRSRRTSRREAEIRTMVHRGHTLASTVRPRLCVLKCMVARQGVEVCQKSERPRLVSGKTISDNYVLEKTRRACCEGKDGVLGGPKIAGLDAR